MNDKRKIEFLETALKEVLKINKDVSSCTSNSIEFELALEGNLLKRWEAVKKLTEEYFVHSRSFKVN